MMNKPMAKKGFCSIFKGGGLWWLTGCDRLPYMFSLMLCMVLFLPCDEMDQISCIQNPLLYPGCENFRDFDGSVGTEAILAGHFELENLCFQFNSLCFPSALFGFEINFEGLHSEKNNVDVNNFGSCKRLHPPNPNPFAFSSESTPSYVDIYPPLLDWGANSLFTPSLVHLTVGNKHNSSVMHVFEPFSSDGQFYASQNPFSSDGQFYASGFEKLSLAPGEAVSIAFVFWPRRLGSSSTHVVLQTSFGGFVIPAQGLAVQSPYVLQPSLSFDLSLDGRLSWNLSLYNTLNEVLYVEEINARISVYSENASYTDILICRIGQSQNSFGWFSSFCKNGKTEVPWIEVRSHKHWEVLPLNTEIIMEMNLYPPFKGNISGVICVNLQSYKRDKFETIIVPLEAEVDSKATYNSLTGSVSVFFDSLVPWDGRDLACTLSVRNRAPYLLSISSITENKNLKVKYMEGLLLYPGTITQVALITYTRPDLLEHIPPNNLWTSDNCILSLLTNDSISPQIDISCEDLVQTCCWKGVRSGFKEPKSSFIGLKSRELKLTNARTGSLESAVEESLPPKLKFQGLLEADRLILGNWRSQGIMSNLSVLKDQELSFPVIQIGSQFSKWITVHNPSQKPVVMQLVLNSGAIIDHCKFPDDSFMKDQDGFSIPDTAITQVLVHPFESAQVGPVLFRPSRRCIWRSSILIRNNLSGVEWLTLRAFGGSHSLLLLEGSGTVKRIEFKLDLPTNSSVHLESSRSCSHQLYKEIYATNAGDFPLEIRKLDVSGAYCGSDGFVIHNCRGFSLASGESMKLLLSYQPDFSAKLVQRNLKLTMDTGFLVIPMEASLPVHLVDMCKKSLVWTVIWKLLAPFFSAVSVICLLLFVLMHPIALGGKTYSVKSENTIAISRSEKPSHVHHSTRQARPIKKNEKRKDNLVIDGYPCCEHSVDGNTQKVKVKKGADHQKKSTLPSPPPTNKISFETLDKFEASESPECVNLTVKVWGERRRRRRKKAGGGGLASKFELSSSQSGNSTPSSPMSPPVFTPNSSFSSFNTVSKEQNHEKKLDFGFTMAEKVSDPPRHTKRPVLASSTSFPGSGYLEPTLATPNFLASSPIAPYARAPGSKLNKEKGMKTEDVSFGKEYTYDIWGNHFCVHLMGKVNELSSKVCDASEGEPQSFFTRDPQSLMMMSSAQSECSGHKLTLMM